MSKSKEKLKLQLLTILGPEVYDKIVNLHEYDNVEWNEAINRLYNCLFDVDFFEENKERNLQNNENHVNTDNKKENNMTTQIYESTDYSLFEIHDLNRTVNKNTKAYQELKNSIETHGFISAYPIHCVKNGNDRLKVKAGHHRLEAARELGIPIKYVVTTDNVALYDLEQAGVGKWKLSDYLNAYVQQDYYDYKVVKEYMDKTGIKLNNALAMFLGRTAGSYQKKDVQKFAKGDFMVKNYEHPRLMADMVLFLKNEGIRFADATSFVKSMSKMLVTKEFNVEHFKQQVKRHGYVLKKQRDMHSYLENIEEMYNYRISKKQKINLAFLANQAARDRQPTKH